MAHMAKRESTANWWAYLVLGLALAIVLALLCWGIYLGAVHRTAVLDFEHRYLGMELPQSAPGEEAGLVAEAQPGARPASQGPAGPTATAPGNAARVGAPTGVLARSGGSTPGSGQHADAPPMPSASDAPHPSGAGSQPPSPGQNNPALATPAPEESLAANRGLPITVQVKALVDADYVAAHSDWLARVQQTVAEVSRIYRDNFGIDLNLVGLVRWPIAVAGQSIQVLHEDLVRRPREGADVLLGLLNRELDAEAYALGNRVTSATHNGAYGLAGLTPGARQVFLGGVLRSLGHLLGAVTVTDASSPAYQLGSWMGSAAGPEPQAYWIDPENRRRILERKTRPFAPETFAPESGRTGP